MRLNSSLLYVFIGFSVKLLRYAWQVLKTKCLLKDFLFVYLLKFTDVGRKIKEPQTLFTHLELFCIPVFLVLGCHGVSIALICLGDEDRNGLR